MRQDGAADGFPESGPIGEVGFQVLATASNQVIPDVRSAIGRRGGGRRLPRTFDGFQRHAKLRFAAAFRDLLDNLPLAIAAEEIHSRVHTGRIAA